jgi:hypothetical protein
MRGKSIKKIASKKQQIGRIFVAILLKINV